ncbi:enoyl-CoA hydratase/isomerase family protein [Pseudoruegeria sp. SHC-113]|uniref:enoyl-CoA hydratase/isomerase family protein n=1 Tax=Pseudoruegeria sp. SHC-113 TaxID=2855439 RepID=UPI0021BB8AF4|nr:enoyl-CoA hydratase/isomerase family protein [Pseudoruegeria sp. SHC-113]MCT8159930.1 enoyl-CoA hydratase/isomerase family protein [Pseudoruegeria sp. SHC-113]
MSSGVVTQHEGDLAILTPPVRLQSRFCAPTLSDLAQAIEAAERNTAVHAILIELGQGRGGTLADLLETDPKVAADLGQLCDRVEACGKPVIARLSGRVRAGTAALALACHYRLVTKEAQLDFPAARLGLVPAGGVTQRLPRIAGAEVALSLLQTGAAMGAAEMEAAGLSDGLLPDVTRDAALAGVRALGDIAPRPARARREGLADGAAFQAALARGRASADSQRRPSALAIADCVESAQLLPFEAGCARELTALQDAADTDAARALRHALQAERRATLLPEAFKPSEGAQPAPTRIRRVVMAAGGRDVPALAFAFLIAGVEVVLFEERQAPLEASLTETGALLESLLKAGAIDAETRSLCLHNLNVSLGVGDLGMAGLAYVPEGYGADEAAALVSDLHKALGAGAVLSVAEPARLEALAAALPEGTPLCALGFAQPLETGQMVEITPGAGCAPERLQAVVGLVARLARLPVFVDGRAQELVAALHRALTDATGDLIAKGCEPEAVVAALRGWGLTPAGYALLLAQAPRGAGEALPEAEIVALVLAALANAGARLVEAGVVESAAHVDAAALHAFAFPRWKGGPMFQADLTGLLTVRKHLLKRAEVSDAPVWQVAPLLERCIRNGEALARAERGE